MSSVIQQKANQIDLEIVCKSKLKISKYLTVSTSKPENYETLRGISWYMLKRNQNELKMMIALWRKTVAAIVEWPYVCISGFYSIYNFSKDHINHHLGDQEKGGRHSVEPLLKKIGCCSRLKMKMGICCRFMEAISVQKRIHNKP